MDEIEQNRQKNQQIWEDESASIKDKTSALRGICEYYYKESNDTLLVLGALLEEYASKTNDSTMIAMSMLSHARYKSQFSNWQADTTFIPKIESLLPGINDSLRKIDALIYLASANRHQGQFEESSKYAQLAYTQSRSIKYFRGERGALHMKGLVHRSLSRLDSAVYYFRQAIEVIKKEDDDFMVAQYENDLAAVLLRVGKQEEALALTTGIIEKWEDKESRAAGLLATCYFRLGRLYEFKEQVSQALNEYLKSLDICEKYKIKKIKVAIQSSLSDLYTAIGDFENAIRYKFIVLDYVKTRPNQDNIITSLANIGIVYQKFEKPDSLVEHYFKAAYNLADSVGNIRSKAFTSVNLGNFYIRNGNLQEAEKLLNFGLEIYEKEGALFILHECYGVMATLYQKKQDYNQARAYAQKSLDLCLENGYLEGHAKMMELMYDLEKEIGNTKDALKYHEKYRELQDSINRNLKSTEFTKIQYLYEDSIQQIKDSLILAKEQALMEQELAESRFRTTAATIGGLLLLFVSLFTFLQYRKVRKARKIVEASLQKEKATSMALVQEQARVKLKSLTKQMDPHFMFNSLQSISHYVVENDRKSANKYLVSFARLMRQSMNYSQKEYMCLEDEIELLNTYLELEQLRFGMGFDFEINIADTIDISSIEIPPMFIQPHVENAVWHGMRHRIESPGSFIKLYFVEQGDYLICEVVDNGIGRDAAKTLNQKIRSGHQSISGDNMEERIALLNSLSNRPMILQIGNAFNNDPAYPGTKVVIKMPI